MSKGINRVIIIGNLGQDPETRSMPSGGAVANVSVATSESWKDKNSGEKMERTEWHRVVFFNRLAEIVGQYLKKGSKIYIEGQLRTRKWEKDGVDHYSTEVIAKEMQMLDGGDAAPRPKASSSGGSPSGGAQAQADNDFSDDIPF